MRFAKQGKIKFISHRDVARVFERALRRADLPVAYTEGFSPRPKLSFGLALSNGHESLAEYLDVHFGDESSVGLDQVPVRLADALPDGITVQAAVEIDRSMPSLQAAVTSCTWRIEVPDVSQADLETAVGRVNDAVTLPVTRTRKGKEVTDDIRSNVMTVAVVGPTARGAELEAELGTQPRACRPSELLRALDARYREGRVVRTHQWTQAGDDRREPIELAPSPAGHALERAS